MLQKAINIQFLNYIKKYASHTTMVYLHCTRHTVHRYVKLPG